MIDCNEWRTEKRHECANIGESKTTRIMMATVPHVTSGLGLRKFQADGFLLTRVYKGQWLTTQPLAYSQNCHYIYNNKINCKVFHGHESPELYTCISMWLHFRFEN